MECMCSLSLEVLLLLVARGDVSKFSLRTLCGRGGFRQRDAEIALCTVFGPAGTQAAASPPSESSDTISLVVRQQKDCRPYPGVSY